ncbi:hypothetical protein HDC34_003048 [Pseudoclavibacter sp. JAI123]|uniref:hypothetical protein n=1 Tax=Pseudoclavibacter sp. JAI123 TaxID=2723065 RepID=UPI0015C82723|nr:hypothetical protein [Pseudoclavibacter sp. JAI123]NYF14713.1 hypothetical protein [Pseudoclavibacter sp. JAI123]
MQNIEPTKPGTKTETTALQTTSRRSLLTAAAWSAPVLALAVAAPLAAASTLCIDPDFKIDWGLASVSGTSVALGRSTPVEKIAVFTPQPGAKPGSTNIAGRVTHTFAGQMRTEATNARISSGFVGGIGQRGYQISQHNGASTQVAPTANDVQTVTFSFEEDLYNVRFAITDIDRMWQAGFMRTRDFIDGVVLESSAPWAARLPVGSTVTGAGRRDAPWRNTANEDKNEDGPGGQVDVVFPGPMRSFTIRYSNLGHTEAPAMNGAPTQNTNQTIFVTGMTVERRTVC